MKQAEIGARKRIGFAERAHCNVLRRPRTDAGNLTELRQERIGIGHAFKVEPSFANRTSESADGLRTLLSQADTSYICLSKDLGGRKQVGEAFCVRNGFAERLRYATRERGRSLNAD